MVSWLDQYHRMVGRVEDTKRRRPVPLSAGPRCMLVVVGVARQDMAGCSGQRRHVSHAKDLSLFRVSDLVDHLSSLLSPPTSPQSEGDQPRALQRSTHFSSPPTQHSATGVRGSDACPCVCLAANITVVSWPKLWANFLAYPR